ncbi:MAG TPA: sugar transferase [Candidatus Caccousia avistercoris]|nr:sugar transferase [Candidatus Caccousia avistercoris]
MQNPETEAWLARLQKRKAALAAKRVFDVAASLVILTVTSPFFLLLALAVKLDSKGPVFYRQVRVGRYGRDFRIFKFRTMVQNADKIGLSLTVGDDPRITRVGRFIRRCRLDEFSQLLNVLGGSMSLVGPRPEVRRYVNAYAPEYMATLLVRPGITAPSSIAFKDEDKLLEASSDPEKAYVEQVLPPKMKLNLEYLKNISLWGDIKILFQTAAAILK